MDTTELRQHLTETHEYIERARWAYLENQTLTIPDPEELKTFHGFGPKPPSNLNALELADMEAAFIGNLYDYVTAYGIVPQVANNAFWRRNTGEVLGLKPSGIKEDAEGEYYPELSKVIQHLKAYAGEVVMTFGVDEILRAGLQTRFVSKFYFSKPHANYQPLKAAAKEIGIHFTTLYDWVEHEWVDYLDGTADEILVDVEAGKRVKDILKSKRKYDAKKRYENETQGIAS